MTRFAKLLAPAVALSVAFGGVAVPGTLVAPAAVAQTGTSTPVIDTTGFTTDQWIALTSQATLEMVNEYRVANGLHPLRTHVVYNTNAENYSKEMARTGVLKHSNSDVWGWSGENVLLRNSYLSNLEPGTRIPHDKILNPPKMTKEQWARLAVLMFEDWRNSPPHNQGMLNSEFQGIGLGIAFDGNDTAWGTTMFYTEDVTLTDGSSFTKPESDPKTVEAKASGKPFYMAGGAMQALGIAGVQNPTDRKGYNPSYSGFLRQVSVKYPGGRVVEETRSLSISGGRAGQEAKNRGLRTEADSRIWRASNTPTPTPTTKTNAPTSPTTPKPVSKPTPTTAAPSPAPSSKTTTSAPAPTSTPRSSENRPTSTPTPETEGSSLSVGGIIGIVVGVLAALGLGAVAMGMMNGGFKLPF